MTDTGTAFVIRFSPSFDVRTLKPTPIAPGGATRCRTGTAGLEGTAGLIDEAET